MREGLGTSGQTPLVFISFLDFADHLADGCDCVPMSAAVNVGEHDVYCGARRHPYRCRLSVGTAMSGIIDVIVAMVIFSFCPTCIAAEHVNCSALSHYSSLLMLYLCCLS